MSRAELIAFLSGVVTLGFAVVGWWFLKFWKRTGDRLFVHFAVAFWLFALNQLLIVFLSGLEREISYEYILRVLGFVIILVGIAGKNTGSSRS